MNLIDRDALKRRYESSCIGDCEMCSYSGWDFGGNHICRIIEDAPTIDAIPIEEDTHGFHCFEDMCDMPDDKCEVCKRSYEHGFAAGKAQARLEKIFEFQKTHARVVRCRDCIHSVFVAEANDYLCRYMSVDQSDPDFRIGGNWFCADGERRDKN